MGRINLENDISSLGLKDDVVNIFREYNINIIDNLWSLKRKDLKDMNFTTEQINHIIIKMQLKGMDLNRKKY